MAKSSDKKRAPLMLPVVSLSAEHLVMGHLMRRNVLTYKAPPGNEGYDLICMHPEPKKAKEILRIQVKSRYQTDCDRAFPVKDKTFEAFDYLVVVFLNIGNFYGTSYFVDPRGNFLAKAGEGEDALVVAEMDLDMIDEVRAVWQFFRDRRPETYEELVAL